MQHSPEDAQGVPGGLQNDAATHVPVLSHSPEQHWLSSGSQAAPLARHTVEGEAQRPAARSQNPEQQSASCPHERNSSAQVPSGSVQTPFAQALVQQVAPERQVPPAAVHAAGSTQRPPAQAVSSAWQQSDGAVQPVPSRGMHAFAVQPFAPSQENPMQQSSDVPHAAAGPPQEAGGTQLPAVQLSPELQHGVVASQPAPLLATHWAGPTQRPASQVSAPLQHGSAVQSPPVFAQLAGAVQTSAVHVSAPLQQRRAPAQLAPVPAQASVAASQTSVPGLHAASGGVASAPQQGTEPAQLAPIPAHVDGAMQKPGDPRHSVPAQQVSPAPQD
jgi:hypothetical protein